jgi:hypothetical protein
MGNLLIIERRVKEMNEMKFRLVRRAKVSGADLYEYSQEGAKDWMVIYIPQSISRKEGEPKEVITISIVL